MKKKYLVSLFTFSIIFILLFLSNYLRLNLQKPSLKINKQDSAYEFGPYSLKFLSMGNQRLFASLIWIQTLLEGDEVHHKLKDTNSWMFYRFNTISILDPYFYENYLYGGKYLSIIKDDVLGAETLYRRGLDSFPDDFHLIKDSAFNYYFEMGETKKAYKLYMKILNHPLTISTFPLLPGLLARMTSELHSLKDAYILLENSLLSIENPYILRKTKERLYAIRAEIDLKCLNRSDFKKCHFVDYLGNMYVKRGKEYFAPMKWTPFRLRKRNRP